MTQVSMKTALRASAEAVWKTIGDFSTVDRYVAGIVRNQTEGSGVGSTRTLTLLNGSVVIERLESLDEKSKTLTYSVLQTPLPMKGYRATMKVKDLGNRSCELSWESNFRVTDQREEAVQKIISRLYALGFEGLKRLHEDR